MLSLFLQYKTEVSNEKTLSVMFSTLLHTLKQRFERKKLFVVFSTIVHKCNNRDFEEENILLPFLLPYFTRESRGFEEKWCICVVFFLPYYTHYGRSFKDANVFDVTVFLLHSRRKSRGFKKSFRMLSFLP